MVVQEYPGTAKRKRTDMTTTIGTRERDHSIGECGSMGGMGVKMVWCNNGYTIECLFTS